MSSRLVSAAVLSSLAIACGVRAAPVASVQNGSDIPADWHQTIADRDFQTRDVMIPMRDGVRLRTILLIPKGSAGAPMVLQRTPYGVDGFQSGDSPRLRERLSAGDRIWADDGYIIVAQDIRGKYGSEGRYIMTRPPIGPLNPTTTDDTTNAYDTIEWLAHHVPESNGRVGMIGSSYDGWAVVMALLGPHPALKVAAPASPMIDGWMGDDWFHHGAFRQINLDYIASQSGSKGRGEQIAREGPDDYQELLRAGSAGDYAARHGLDRLPWWQRMVAHPAYDGFWQGQALDRLLTERPSSVPTLWLQGLWDQEDIYGAVHSWEALKAAGRAATNHLVMGPWYHSQFAGRGDTLGALKWSGDTSVHFRDKVLVPFFDTYLKDKAPSRPMPHVLIYDPAEDRWDEFADWPGVAADALTPVYLQPDGGLSYRPPAAGADSFVADPARPVPFEPLPARLGDRASWSTWLVDDQRFAYARPDVPSYESAVLDKPVRLRGAPVADLFVRTTGTDMDVVVKIIDVFPAAYPEDPKFAGYQLPISLDIFRGRYRLGFDRASPIPADTVQKYRFRLPTVNYTVRPGHRIMVQIQSSLFPLYDRNPQTFVPNIFHVRKEDYRKATVTVAYGGGSPSAVLLPIVRP